MHGLSQKGPLAFSGSEHRQTRTADETLMQENRSARPDPKIPGIYRGTWRAA
jgi:hypothetical protein